MSKRQWTPEQAQSIHARGGSLLVSAAAGSGKTAVLVERILQLITDSVNPVDVDRLLVVTFTRAAAAEMRGRLSAALSQKMAEEPDNLHYQRQQMLLPRAYISTVDGFCARLLQEYAGQTGLPVGFRVAEESRAALLAAQALDEVLEENYRRRDPAFMALAAQINSGRNDLALRTAVENAYDFMQAQPFPDKWLQYQIDAYSAVIPLEKTPWMAAILPYLDMRLEYAAHLLYRGYEISVAAGLEPYIDTLLAEYRQMCRLRETLPTAPYDEMEAAVTGFRFDRLSAVKAGDAAMAEAKEEAKALRDEAKKVMAKCADLFCGTEEECRADLALLAPLADALGGLVRQYTDRYVALKRKEKLLDYSDLEHEALGLLLDAETMTPTPLAEELSRRFAHIMVDEYQDTNAAQDALFAALSRNSENLFYVGDVKQSIYGFRQAMPFLFTDRHEKYAAYDGESPVYPATITLKHNFRSRREVTDTVNFLFRQLMSKRLGEVAYGEEEELKCSAVYPEADCATEWLLADKAAADAAGITDVQAEARLIARRIRELMGEMTVTVGGETRPLEYRDICILLRGRTHIGEYVKELGRMGIPAAADKGAGFLSTPEIQTSLSLLRVIDNPLREVELTAVMLSPLFGFTADDLAAMRVAFGRYLPLYVAVEKTAQEGEDPDLAARCGLLLRRLRRLRVLAVSLPADRLLEAVYRETDMEAVFAARSGGRQRVANLHQLDRIARGFEQGGFRGLSAFVRYLDRLQEQGKDMGGGDTLHQDGVRLMTVHASKGLEFPVVFLARLGGQGSNEDSRKKLLFHHRVGIGMKLTDDAEGEKHIPLPHRAVWCARQMDEKAEELRVWYVALTRAREKLILLYSLKEPRQAIARMARHLPRTEEALPPSVVMQAASPGELLLTAALRHPDFIPYRPTGEATTLPAETAWRVTVCDEAAPPVAAPQAEAVAEDAALTAVLRQRMDYVYPYAPLQSVPAMLAASHLSHQALSRRHVAVSRPAFLQKEGMTAADKGTALHTFMQYADFTAAAEDPETEVRRLLAEGFLTQQQAQVIPAEKVRRFFGGGLYRRIAAADRVWREYHYILDVDAGTLADLPAEMAKETVVVQGIADCVFREGDRLILVDYKTDKVDTAEELVERYRSQMLFYKQALETILGLPVTEMLLYSFALDGEIPVNE